MIDLAIIGGSGVYQLAELSMPEKVPIETPFGAPSCPPVVGEWNGRRVAFLARHGKSHEMLPHQVNYRANVWALNEMAVGAVLAINAVGSLNADLSPGTIVLPDQLIDYTWGREHTFAGQLGEQPLHVDFGQPFSSSLRERLIAAGAERFASTRATCAVTQGPRLESAAEIRRLGRDGCDLVGMTMMPEAALARELGLSYASVAVVANWAAGFDPKQSEISMREVLANVESGLAAIKSVLVRFLG